ncbi:hypothetical protein VTN00DRAFT_7009 [Thermoascus crustaceus]|uniref:uncharacterized protein n=1 Tax=Thermoascus crustaceus TaxID=5088 RepID=UPI0037430F20
MHHIEVAQRPPTNHSVAITPFVQPIRHAPFSPIRLGALHASRSPPRRSSLPRWTLVPAEISALVSIAIGSEWATVDISPEMLGTGWASMRLVESPSKSVARPEHGHGH